MSFRSIDKAQYNRRIKSCFFAICVYMLIMGVGGSTLLIAAFGNQQGDNFWFNLSGVVLAGLSLALVFNYVKANPYLDDILYVRALKAQMNKIYRKQRKVNAAAEAGDLKAISILDFSHRASKYVYQLDNNTLTLEELEKAHQKVLALAEQFSQGDIEPYQRQWLDIY